jgi:hypothetical protein
MEYSSVIFGDANSGELLSTSMVAVHELIAWELDEYPHRLAGSGLSEGQFAKEIGRAKQTLTGRGCYEPCDVLLEKETARIQHLFAAHTQRTDLQDEYEGLEWTVGVVDLRHVLAFQRRLVFDPELRALRVPKQEDWPALLSFSFGPARSIEYRMTFHERDGQGSEFILQSDNPDLQLRPVPDTKVRSPDPFSLYGGCPFFEVAEFRGRWLLRDGYHRAYHLLRAGVYYLPAVVIRARTIDEVGATQSWFFDEEQLFSSHPPRVMDFLDDDLVLRYRRPRFKKIFRIRIDESLQPENETDDAQGDQL